MQEAWATGVYCTVDNVQKPVSQWTLRPSEDAAIDVLESATGDAVSDRVSAYAELLGVCVNPFFTVASIPWAVAKAALTICPDAPRAAELRLFSERKVLPGGSFVVGVDYLQGTYRTAPGVQNCYWERVTANGTIIANGFVTFAPNGVTVTIRDGEGFTSDNCGMWTLVD
jgi:hypothetical protein